MTEVKFAAEIARKTASEAVVRLSQKEKSLAEQVKLSEANTKVLERRDRDIEAAQIKLKEMISWIAEINPNFNPYDPQSAYQRNCGSCALAVHNRLKGYKDVVAGRINIAPQDEDMEELTGLRCAYMDPGDIENILRSRGPGSELIVGVNRYEGSGHWFNAYYDGNKVYTVDGQIGKIMDWPHDYQGVSDWCALV